MYGTQLQANGDVSQVVNNKNMYIAKIINKIENDFGGINFTVKFIREDGKEIDHTFNGVTSKDDLKRLIKSQKEFYENSDSVKEGVALEEIIDTTSEVVIPVEKTPEEILEQERLVEYTELCSKQDKLKRDIARGVIDETNLEYVDVCDKLKKKYRPKYSGI